MIQAYVFRSRTGRVSEASAKSRRILYPRHVVHLLLETLAPKPGDTIAGPATSREALRVHDPDRDTFTNHSRVTEGRITPVQTFI